MTAANWPRGRDAKGKSKKGFTHTAMPQHPSRTAIHQAIHYLKSCGIRLPDYEERFCEFIGLMYANGDFSKAPPADLEELWEACWSAGLARMT